MLEMAWIKSPQAGVRLRIGRRESSPIVDTKDFPWTGIRTLPAHTLQWLLLGNSPGHRRIPRILSQFYWTDTPVIQLSLLYDIDVESELYSSPVQGYSSGSAADADWLDQQITM